MMRSYLKPTGRLPTSQYTREPGLFRKFTSRGPEIALAELSAVLHLDMRMTAAITSSPSFPTPIGRRCGEGVWATADVVAWLRASGWESDAAALERW